MAEADMESDPVSDMQMTGEGKISFVVSTLNLNLSTLIITF
jgi:hypothetical protein